MKRKRSISNKPGRIIPDENLPVLRRSNDILRAVSTNDVLIVIAETGSGKTTQIPQIILDNHSDSSILITQPRRVAAISVASRVAAERGTKLGEQVGYAIRFDDTSTRGVTRIRYVTDGVMLREALSCGITGLRNRYSHIIIDEIHERSVNTDIVLGIVKRMLISSSSSKSTSTPVSGISKFTMRTRLPFKVILMSATTDADKLKNFFMLDSQLKVDLLNIEGKTHPVRVLFATAPPPEFVVASVNTCIQIIHDHEKGDILVFLPGQDDIITACSSLRKSMKEKLAKETWRSIQILPLYAAMSPEEQLRAIQPTIDGSRKVIFATNIAETSVTIPGIVFVVDCGLIKVRESCIGKKKGMKSDILQLQPVSKAQAEQRLGRAGRTGPGFLYRLYTDKQFNSLPTYPTPEILRSETTGIMLQIISLVHFFHEHDVEKFGMLSFPLIDPVPQREMEFGLETLVLLGAVDNDMNLTRTGELMSRLPVSPMLARTLLESLRLDCVQSMASVASVMCIDGLIFQEAKGNKREKIVNAQRRFINENGDHLTNANALHAVWQLMDTQKQQEFCKDYFLNYRSISAAISIRRQLLGILQHGDMTAWGITNKLSTEVESEIRDVSVDELVRRCLVAGYFRNVAQKSNKGRGYIAIGRGTNEFKDVGKELKGAKGDIHPSCVLLRMNRKKEPEFLLYNEFIWTNKPYFRTVTTIERRWMLQHTTYFKESA